MCPPSDKVVEMAARQAKREVSDASDRKLIHLFDSFFTHTNSHWCLSGSLSIQDREDVGVWAWPNGDSSGDKEQAGKSTSGRYVEFSSKSGNRFQIGWASHKQGSTLNSTPEAETIGLGDCVRLDGLALRSSFALILKRPVGLRCLEDTETFIKVIESGYSTKMRYLPRTQCTSVGFLHELFHGPENAAVGPCILQHHQGKTRLGDHFTKELHSAESLKESCVRIGS